MRRPAVFLDRDNTIIHNDGDLGDPEEVRLIQGVAPAIASLCGLGYRVVVITNQGGVARGKYTEEDVHAVHARIEAMVVERANGARIDGFYFCPFHPEGKVSRYKREHDDRKPRPGMLLRAAEELNLDLSQSWTVGDAERDVEAGAAAGTRTVLLREGWTHDAAADLRREAGSRPVRVGDHRSGGNGGDGGGGADDGTLNGDGGAAGLASGGSASGGSASAGPDFVAKNLVEAVRIIASQRKPEAGEELGRVRVAGKRWDAEAMKALQRPVRRRPPPGEPDPGPAPTPDPEWPGAPVPPVPEPDPSPPVEPGPAATPSQPQAGGVTVTAVAVDAGTAAATRPPRPFRPWTVGPPEADEPAPATRPPRAGNGASASADEVDADPAPEGPTLPPSAPPLQADPAAWDELNQNLRLILSELRTQRGTSGEAAYHGIVAIVLQSVAVLCLLGGLWMGGGDGGTALFWRWLGVALIVQLGAITALLFARSTR